MPTVDSYIPNYLKDADNDGNDASGCSDCTTDYLDDVAFYARTNDLRTDLDGNQSLYLYTIFAFADDEYGPAAAEGRRPQRRLRRSRNGNNRTGRRL